MGCDIHIVLERKEPDAEWVGLWTSDVRPDRRQLRPVVAQRDYAFFAEVAAVRGRSSTATYPRNLPRDVSRLAWLQYQRCPTDYHSASWMTVSEFVSAWLRVNPKRPDVRPEFAASDLLGVDGDEEDRWGDDDPRVLYRVVFWFDN